MQKSVVKMASPPDAPQTPPPLQAQDTAPLPMQLLLDLLTNNLGATVSVIDTSLRFRYVNVAFARWFNLTPAQMLGVAMIDVFGEYNHARYLPYLERCLAGEQVNYERLLREPSGTDGWRTISLTPWRDDAGNIIGVVNCALDVNEMKVTMEALRAANQRLSSHMDNSPLAVLEMDAALTLTHFSERASQLFGWSGAQMQGQSLMRLLGGVHADQSQLLMAFRRLQDGDESRNRVEATHPHKDGTPMHCEWFNSALTNAQGQVMSIMALVEDVSAQFEAAERLRYIALHDSLTGLPNRSAFQTQVEAALVRARRGGGMVAVLFIDLDGFKYVNDNFGHGAGDEVLREVARRLRNAVRGQDAVARMGGDEFVVLVESGIAAATPATVSTRIFAALEPPVAFTGGTAQIGASIGVAEHPPLESHAERLIKRADAAMYEAKRAGKGCVRHAPG